MPDKIIARKIMFYVQHLLGVGHLQRALRLSCRLQDAGMAVTLVSGGMPYPHDDLRGVKLIQLAPARAADAEFSHVLNALGAPIDDDWRAQRKAALLGIFADVAPDALLIEMFPFGRRQFGFELLPLLQAARARDPVPLILCSARDILIPSDKPGRTEEAVAHVQHYFDYVLVHGDRDFIRLEESYPAASGLSEKIIYTGYVTADAPQSYSGLAGKNEVLISAGGGAVGEALMQAAVQARSLSQRAGNHVWRLLIGANAPAGQLLSLQLTAPDGVIVEAARPDFPQMLLNCACSVSQGGYNTIMDILQARAVSDVPAVIVPFTTAREREQWMRARALARAGIITLLPEQDLNSASLAAAIDHAMEKKNTPKRLPDRNGGAVTARFIQEKLDAQSAH